jgi:hypothetical protein
MYRSLSVPARAACALAFGVLAQSPAVADDAARISRLETEIQQLRAQLDEQNRRIQRLEAELERRAGVSQPRSELEPSPRADGRQANTPVPSGPQPWHTAPAWERIHPGMSEAEVVAVLGAPTVAESVGVLKSLFYRGLAGRAELSGHVNLKEGRVVAVSKPAF